MAAKPYLTIKGASEAIEFYRQAFGAVERVRLPGDDGRLGHAEIQIGDHLIMLSDEYPEINVLSPTTLGGTTVGLHIEVADVEAVFNSAVAAGAKVINPIKEQFGNRIAKLQDPFGHYWYISTVIEEISYEEMRRRYDEMMRAG